MPFKFERLEVWQLALAYVDEMYALADKLPRSEEYNLKSQLVRAATSVALNIAEGSTSQTDSEQARFIGYAIRSLMETVACQHIMRRRGAVQETKLLDEAYAQAERLAAKLHNFRKAMVPRPTALREPGATYEVGMVDPLDGPDSSRKQ